MKSRFVKPAEDELTEAVDHYDQITAGLGDRFLAEIRSSVRLIESFPKNSPAIIRQVRKKVLLEFPYSVFYAIAEEESGYSRDRASEASASVLEASHPKIDQPLKLGSTGHGHAVPLLKELRSSGRARSGEPQPLGASGHLR